ncbi:MAG: flavin reductase family protein [Phenylobacterium sp.]|uniref:flavin reductase family protein n=1 Tax=Phenylobacterium sp. TaxID=1871053 RepID=UPI0027372F9B|nr:flavin reductase family protein [Phenylobacterium sp.]MDP3750011.1 flavin reductase family protein [Phenylobacterium sp.]
MLPDLRKALRCFPTSIVVVTTRGADGAPFGLAVNAFCTVQARYGVFQPFTA